MPLYGSDGYGLEGNVIGAKPAKPRQWRDSRLDQ
jgi:hypothetical protein